MIFKTCIWKQPLGGILKNNLKTAERQPAALLITSGKMSFFWLNFNT